MLDIVGREPRGFRQITRRPPTDSNQLTHRCMRGATVTQPHPGAQAALESLAAEFNPADFAITLTLDEGCPPLLTVTNRHCPLSEQVLADGQSYWFPWAEPIGPVNDPAAAAAKLARVLRAVPEPSHG
jgi:hypothetical protein